MPRDKRLRTACAALLHELGRPERLEEWSDIANAASRTLARLLASEVGSAFTAMFRRALGKTPRDYSAHSIG
jgi:AraC-like DNA-binding protein